MRGRDLEGRGLAGPARDQLPLRRRADDGRQPRDLQERRQGDRAPERLLDHVHGEAVRGRGSATRATSTRRSSATASRRSRDDDGALRPAASPGRSRASKELAVFLAPTINSYKRYAAGSWAPTTLAWGHDNRTCGFRVVGHGAARRVGDAHPRRRRQPVPRLRGDDRGRACTGSRTSSSCRRRSRGTRTSRTPSASRRRCARRSPRSRAGRWRAPRSATRSSTTT